MEYGPGNPWIIRRRPRPRAALRLVCFAYAGADDQTGADSETYFSG